MAFNWQNTSKTFDMIARFERGFIYASIKNDLGFFSEADSRYEMA
jgi:hypothetical protein